MSLETPNPEVKVGPGYDRIMLVESPDSELWQQSVELEYEVFHEAEYVDARSELEDEYRPYEARSKFISITRQGMLAGSTRLIDPSDDGFKTIKDAKAGKLTIDEGGWSVLQGYDLTRDGFEVGTLAVPPDLRTGPFDSLSVSASLYAGITGYSGVLAERLGRDKRGFVIASFDEKYLEGFKDAFGESVYLLGPSQEYMGSKTTPVLIDVDKLLDDNHKGLTPMLLGLAGILETNE
jgi:hypothetical protein